jgi:hypothetical protein
MPSGRKCASFGLHILFVGFLYRIFTTAALSIQYRHRVKAGSATGGYHGDIAAALAVRSNCG